MYLEEYGTYVQLTSGTQIFIDGEVLSERTFFKVDAKDFSAKFFKEFCKHNGAPIRDENLNLCVVRGGEVIHWHNFNLSKLGTKDKALYYILGKLKDVYK